MTTDYALEMLDITKTFPGVKALNAVTIRVSRGEVHGLIGENGAGKSTLMKILDGVYPTGTYEGKILLDGKAVDLRSSHDAKAKGVGFVPQEITVIEGLSVAENMFVGHLSRPGSIVVNFRSLFAQAKAFLQERNIRLDPRHLVTTLTTSQRQLVMIARALTTNPSVLILDEPTSSLTKDETDNLFQIVRGLQTRGVTTVFISHKLDELVEIADRITVLRDGCVVAGFDRGAYTESDIVTAMVGREITTLYPTTEAVAGAEALRVTGLTVPHPRIIARNLVEDVSFSVRKGEVMGLAGLVGSGRSEVVNALYGRIPYSGQIAINGKPVTIRRPLDAKRFGIGMLTEERKREGLLLSFPIRENITINNLPAVSQAGVLSRRQENQYANEYRQKLSIRTPSVSTLVSSLSGGNQQKVVLAKTLIAKPKILLLDEPTKGVDVGAKYEIYRIIEELKREGLALIMISSELPELLALSDHIVVLAEGRVTDRFVKADANEERVMLAATRRTEAG